MRSGFWEKDAEREKGRGKGVAATQLDESPEMDGDSNEFEKDQNMEGDSAKGSAAPGGSPEKKRAKAAPLPLGVEKIQNQGEGNCLFLAVSQAIENSGGGAHNHRSVRAAAVTHLRKHAAKYALFWDGLRPDGTKMDSISLESFLKYLDLVGEVGAWAGNLEIAALASTLDRPITVLHEHGQVYQFNAEGSKKDLFLFYQTCGHYECLKTTPEAALALRAKSSPGKTAGGRQNKGGGKKAGPIGPFLKPPKVRWGGTLSLPEATRLRGLSAVDP